MRQIFVLLLIQMNVLISSLLLTLAACSSSSREFLSKARLNCPIPVIKYNIDPSGEVYVCLNDHSHQGLHGFVAWAICYDPTAEEGRPCVVKLSFTFEPLPNFFDVPFEAEVAALSRLQALPSVVRLIGTVDLKAPLNLESFGNDAGSLNEYLQMQPLPGIVMERLQSEFSNLDQYLYSETLWMPFLDGRTDLMSVLKTVRCLCDQWLIAFFDMADKGIIHTDLFGGNVIPTEEAFVSSDGSSCKLLRVIDFGRHIALEGLSADERSAVITHHARDLQQKIERVYTKIESMIEKDDPSENMPESYSFLGSPNTATWIGLSDRLSLPSEWPESFSFITPTMQHRLIY